MIHVLISYRCPAEQSVTAIRENEALEERLQNIAADFREELHGKGLPNGSPAALILCAAAMSCVHMMRKLPNLNQVTALAAHPSSTARGSLQIYLG